LRQGAIVVKAQHRGEVVARQIRRALHGDVRVGICGVAHDQHLDVALGDLVQRLALHGEDGAVGLEQVLALHTLAARARADQHGDIDILERNFRIGSRNHAGEQRECAVFEFHDDALERSLGFFVGDFEQLQNDRLVLAEHFAGGDTEQQAISDLSGSAGDCDTNGWLGHENS
jgi:hypothetical protein